MSGNLKSKKSANTQQYIGMGSFEFIIKGYSRENNSSRKCKIKA